MISDRRMESYHRRDVGMFHAIKRRFFKTLTEHNTSLVFEPVTQGVVRWVVEAFVIVGSAERVDGHVITQAFWAK